MATQVTVKKSSNPNCHATVCISVKPSPVGFRTKSLLDDTFNEKVVSLASGIPFEGQTYRGWEGACLSGLFYARRKLENQEVEAVIRSVAGCLDNEDLTIFAVAARIAYLKEMNFCEPFSEKDMAGWEIAEVVSI